MRSYPTFLALAAILLCAGSGHELCGCGLSMTTEDQCTSCLTPKDCADGYVVNDGFSGTTCAWAEGTLVYNVNESTIDVWLDGVVGYECAYLEEDQSTTWNYEAQRYDWCDPAGAKIEIVWPMDCTNVNRVVIWTGTCGACE